MGWKAKLGSDRGVDFANSANVSGFGVVDAATNRLQCRRVITLGMPSFDQIVETHFLAEVA